MRDPLRGARPVTTRRRRRAAWQGAVAALFAALPSPAAAHDLWIAPSSFQAVPGTVVKVELRVGERWRGEAMPAVLFLVERFALVGGAGEVPIASTQGALPAGLVRLAQPGLHWLVYESKGSYLELPAEKFEAYLAEEGLDAVSELRALRGESRRSGTERYHRSAKALLCPRGSAAVGFDRALGLALELVPEGDPCGPEGGPPPRELPLRLELHGEPVEGVLVVALGEERPEAGVSARTDRGGRVVLRLDRPGRWLIKAVHMLPAPEGAGVDWLSRWASLSLEVPAP